MATDGLIGMNSYIDVIVSADGDITGRILPDKRRHPIQRVALHVIANGDVTHEEIAARLAALDATFLQDNPLWEQASGRPLDAPIDVRGTLPDVEFRQRSWGQASSAPESGHVINDAGEVVQTEGLGAPFYDRESGQLVV